MRICVVYDVVDSSRMESMMRERAPEGSPSFFFIEALSSRRLKAAATEGAARPEGYFRADLHVIPAALFLDMEPAERPPLVIASGPVELMAESFRQGCVDYLRSPWELGELWARSLRFARNRIRIDGIELETSRGMLSWGQKQVELSEVEYRLARILALNLNRPVPRAALAYALWGSERDGSRALDVHISALRKKLGLLSPGCARSLRACRSLGYCLLGEACG